MKTFYTFAALMLLASAANAELMATFNKNSLYGSNSYALEVTTDTDWQAAEILINLTTGSLLNVNEGFPSGPKPTFGGENDSGVFTPGFAEAPILAPGALSSDTEFSASWSNTGATDTGTFDIGAFSLSDDAVGTLSGRVVAQNPDDPINGFVFSLADFEIKGGAIVLAGGDPEGLGYEYVGSGASLSEGLQGAFDTREVGGPIILEGALMLSSIGAETLETLDPVADIVNLPSFVTSYSISDEDGDGKYDIMIDADFASLPEDTVLSGDVSFTTAFAGADPAAVGESFSIFVPEPSTYALAGLALFGLVGYARRK